MRGAVAAQLEGVFDRYVDEVFRHMWAEPKKMDDPEVVRVVLEQSGLNAAALLARTQEEHGSERCPRRLRQSDLLRRQRNILRQGPAARRRRRASPGKDLALGVANERRRRTSCALRPRACSPPPPDWYTLWAMGARGSLHARQWPGSPSGGEAVKRRGFILIVISMTGGWRGWRTRFAGVLAPALWLALAASPAAAQVSQQASYADPSFQTILNNPGNLASQVKYAAGAKDDPDIENAISAYDRLLFYNPALARVRFELGVLYARLGSYQQARAYFESALQMRDITPEMAEHAQRYIAILDRKLSPDQFTGFAQTGLRYQTNATLGPGPQPVLASGRNFNSAFTARPDWNWFGSFALNYSHDFGTQDGDALEATLIGYDA
jgi:hypothetical protein